MRSLVEKAALFSRLLVLDVFYSLNDFVEKSGRALELASDRVMKKYGFRCTSAEEQISKIIEKSKSFKSEDKVSCLGMK